MNKKELIKKIKNKEIKSAVLDGIKSVLFVTADDIYRYPRLGDPSRYIGVKLTNEEIKSTN